MYRVSNARRWKYTHIQKYLYLINIGFYSLVTYLLVFKTPTIIGWLLNDPHHELDFAWFIWFPIGLLFLNSFIWQRIYTPRTLGITAISLLIIVGFMIEFRHLYFSDADQVGWGVLTLLSAMFSLYAWYRAKPWRKFKNN